MTDAADVSVIIPAYRNAATIKRALASVATQSVRPRQVIVVDDGSDDETAAIAGACAGLLAGVDLIVIRQANAGAGAARNMAITHATSTWLAFLDADDEWLPGKLEASMAALANGNCVFTSHDMEVVTIEGDHVEFDCARHFQAARDPFVALFCRGYVATSTVVARRSAVETAEGFEPSLRAAQDYDLWLRLAASGAFVVFPGALTRYHANSQGITANIERRRRCSLAVMERNRPFLDGRAPRPAMVVAFRLAVIHYEAVRGFLAQRNIFAAFLSSLRLMSETARAFPKAVTVLAWAWVAAVAIGYLFQFVPLATRALAKFGIGS